jgi:hypothetical protein
MTLHLVYEKAWVPSTRIRLRRLTPRLETNGWPCRVVDYPATAAQRRRFAATLDVGDVVLVHRARPTRREARWWRGLPVRIVYDFDDAIMIGQRSGLRGFVERRRRGSGFRRMLHVSHGASCGNAFLAEQCTGLDGPVAIVPSAVCADVPRARPSEGPPLRIGWVGRGSNLGALSEIGPALASIAKRREVELVVVSDRSLDLPGVPIRWRPWTLESEAAEVARFDVGVMPLPLDSPWSRGKCAYKLLQYMAAGVPAVGSAVGMNPELIRDGRNGLLARTLDDWEGALLALLDDPGLRRRLGDAGRETVLEGYTVEAVGDQLAAFLRAVSSPEGRSSGSMRSSADSTSKSEARAFNPSDGGGSASSARIARARAEASPTGTSGP